MSNTIIFTTTLDVLNFQLATMFHLVTTLCEDGAITRMSITPIDESIPIITYQDIPRTRQPLVVEMPPWHVVVTRLEEVPT
jgi:hypothetical protein